MDSYFMTFDKDWRGQDDRDEFYGVGDSAEYAVYATGAHRVFGIVEQNLEAKSDLLDAYSITHHKVGLSIHACDGPQDYVSCPERAVHRIAYDDGEDAFEYNFCQDCFNIWLGV